MHKRLLTINFQRSITAGVPNTMEVVVAPLNEPSAPAPAATLVGGTQVQTVVLANETNPVVFELVPTDHPDLTQRITYRVAWRERYMGRQYTKDFVMPDFDVAFEDLDELGLIIGGETYLQWSDRGVANGVAGLDSDGNVVDADGTPVGLTAAVDSELRGLLDNEVITRQQADQFLQNFLMQHTADSVADVLASAINAINAAVAQLDGDLSTESAQRQQAVNSLNVALGQIQTTTNALLAQMTIKADLVSGKIPASQLPSVMFGKAVSVPNEAAMLALTSNQVNRGDFAVRPDGIFFLNAADPTVLGNWVQFRDNTVVLSVNGQTGHVTLSAAAVGARPASTPVPLDEVSGLTAVLNTKASTASVAEVSGRVADIEDDPTLVRTTGGMISKAQMPADAAFVTGSNLVAKKDGTVLNLGSGGTLSVEDVGGLQAALDGKANTAHTHPQTDVVGLGSALGNHETRVFDLENRVEVLESLSGGGGVVVGSSVKTSWWSAPAATTALDTVSLRSPFGWNGTNYYYDPAGAALGEAVFPYLTPNGHLKFVARNESAPADPDPASQEDLEALSVTVSAKASQSALDSLTSTVSAKASQSSVDSLTSALSAKASQSSVDSLTAALSEKAAQADLAALTTTVGTKASAASVSALSAAVDTKAAQSTLDTLTATVGTKAAQSTLDTLTATVGTKASQTAMDSLTSRVSAVETGKASLDVNGKIYASQLPNLALTNVVTVASQVEMLALTSTQVQPGDVCLVNDTTVNRGSYVLTGTDPAVIDNWTKLITPETPVVTVNNTSPVSGNITLTADSVGARPAGVNILPAEVTGLVTALAAKVDTSTYTAGLAGKISLVDAQNLLTLATPLKWRADLVDTASTTVPNSTGITIDGVTVSAGDVVLLTNQSPRTNNGLYVARSGATWLRAADMATGSYFLRGSAVVVLGGSANTGTIYQQLENAGVVGTNDNRWTKVLTSGSGSTNALTASSGVKKVAVTSGGVTTYDFQLDTTVAARKWAGYVTPASGNFGTVTHNLGTQNVVAAFRDASTKDAILVGWKPVDNNTISVEFDSPPGSTQFWSVVVA